MPKKIFLKYILFVLLYLVEIGLLLLLKVVFTQDILTSVNICYWPCYQCYQPKFSEKYLVNGKVDVFIQFLLCVNSLWAVVLITLQEEVFKCGCVFLLKSHHDLVT